MKRVIVTGGTRGIGLATCKLFAERGYAVTATYHSDEEAAENARDFLPNVNFIRADVSREEDVHALFAAFESVDVLVLNAGVSLFSQVQDTTAEQYAHVMNTNIGGVFMCAKYAVKKMLERGGAIVTVSSVWGEIGASCESVYSASKGAVIAFTKSLAKELAPSNITANCVTPGVIETKMNAHLSRDDRIALAGEIPLSRFGTSEEVARAILFLAEHRYITGQVLGVNGGFSI